MNSMTNSVSYLVQTTIFNDIAQDVVSTCLQSLLSVSESLEKQVNIYDSLFSLVSGSNRISFSEQDR